MRARGVRARGAQRRGSVATRHTTLCDIDDADLTVSRRRALLEVAATAAVIARARHYWQAGGGKMMRGAKERRYALPVCCYSGVIARAVAA